MTRTRRGIADDDGSAGEVPQFKISRLNRRHILPTKPLTQGMALLRCVRPLLAQSGHAGMSALCPLFGAKRTRRAAITGPIRREDDQECFFQFAD